MIKTPEAFYKNVSGNIHGKSGVGIRESKENIVNVSECENCYGLSTINHKEKQKRKDGPFFRN